MPIELTNYEKKVFAIFVSHHTPGFWPGAVQLEGDGRLPVVRSGLRLQDKGLVTRVRSCFWVLTKAGMQLSEQWQKDKVLEKRTDEKKRTGVDPWEHRSIKPC